MSRFPKSPLFVVTIALVAIGVGLLLRRGAAGRESLLFAGAIAMLLIVLAAGRSLIRRMALRQDSVIQDAPELTTLAFPPSSLRK